MDEVNSGQPTAEELAEFERRLELNDGRFTWEEYLAIVDEFAARRSPNRGIKDYLDREPFEL